MNTKIDDRQIDSKGRVTIPKSIRERLNITSGEHVDVDVEDGTIVIRPRISRAEFVEQMNGCINDQTRKTERPSQTPADLKADWTSDLPSDN